MEQCTFKNVNNCLNTKIYSDLETSGGQCSNLYLNVVHFSTPVWIRHLWQLKTVVFLHWCCSIVKLAKIILVVQKELPNFISLIFNSAIFLSGFTTQGVLNKDPAVWLDATRCQFHKHFMSSFCAKILSPKNYKPKL